MPKVGKQDPHMKSPIGKYILIIIIVALLVFLVAPKLVDIYNDNLNDTNDRMDRS